MANFHSVVWIDHQKAVVWNFNDDAQTKSVVKSHEQHQRSHVRKAPHGGHVTREETLFFREVAEPLANVQEILVIGPAQAKDEFVNFLKTEHSELAKKIVAVETADHPTDAELLAYARKHFKVLDRMI
jgi:stalled ribosome rescue protein Dom34